MGTFIKPFNFNYALACSKDELRPDFQYIAFKDGYLYCTDATVLVRSRLDVVNNIDVFDIEKLNGNFMHKDCFKAMFAAKGFTSWEITSDGFVFKFRYYEVLYKFEKDIKNFDQVFKLFDEHKNRCLHKDLMSNETYLSSDVAKVAFSVLDGKYITIAKPKKNTGAFFVYTDIYNYEDQALILMSHIGYNIVEAVKPYTKLIEERKVLKEIDPTD